MFFISLRIIVSCKQQYIFEYSTAHRITIKSQKNVPIKIIDVHNDISVDIYYQVYMLYIYLIT